MSEYHDDFHSDPRLRGTNCLPRAWPAWSETERDLWWERKELGEQEDGLFKTLRDKLGADGWQALSEFDATKNNLAHLEIEQVAARLTRYLPGFLDLIRFAFDYYGFHQEDLVCQPDPRYIPS